VIRVPKVVLSLAIAAALSACAGPPKPPVPDESKRVPANDRRELAALQCSGDLVATKSALSDALLLAERASATAAALQLENARLQVAYRAAAAQRSLAPPSRIFSVFYKPSLTAIELNDSDAAKLLAEARNAAHIEVRGRTDGTVETAAESLVARQRAQLAQMWLIRGGVIPSRIVATWQPVGDHLGPNDSAEGRALNRRVEIEIYAVAPSRGAPDLPAVMAANK
jgi:outer membrane protein OmpA-like peptidoglycan-associated protein